MRRLPVFTPKTSFAPKTFAPKTFAPRTPILLHTAELVMATANPYIKPGRCCGGESRGRAMVGNRRKSAQC